MPEEVWVKGIDPGLKSWSAARRKLIEAREKGKEFETIPCGFNYQHRGTSLILCCSSLFILCPLYLFIFVRILE